MPKSHCSNSQRLFQVCRHRYLPHRPEYHGCSHRQILRRKSDTPVSPNRKYIDLLNSWAVKKAEEKKNITNVEKQYLGKTKTDLWMVLKGAQETRVLAYKALESFWCDFLTSKDSQTFQYYCELAVKAFNDINTDIRCLQKMDSLAESKHLIDRLQDLEQEKFFKILEFYRSIVPIVVREAINSKVSSPNAVSPSDDDHKTKSSKIIEGQRKALLLDMARSEASMSI